MNDASHSLPLGAGLALIGAVTLAAIGSIDPIRLADNGDPGPRLFPALLAGALLLGGVVETALGLRLRSTHSHEPERPATSEQTFPAALVIWALAVAIYLAALPWAGFALATLLLVVALLVWQGTRWWIAAITAAGLVGVIYALFGLAFKVPLPTGLLGI